MPEKTAIEKMKIKDGESLVFVNAPEGYPAALGALPEKVTILNEPSLAATVTQVFVETRNDLKAQVAKLAPSIAPEAALWIAFRKGTSKPTPDFKRDDVLTEARAAGFHNLILISLDEDWSAFKFKATEAPE